MFANADQVRPARGFQGLAQQRPVVRIVVAQKRLVQAAALGAACDVYDFTLAGNWV